MKEPTPYFPTIQKDACAKHKAAKPRKVAGVNTCWACTVARSKSNFELDKNLTLLDQRPDLAREWVAQANGGPAGHVPVNSNQLAEFACGSCGHHFKTKVSVRTKPQGQGCPICYAHQGGRVTVDLNHFPEARSLFESSSRNGGFNISALPVDYKVFWRCRRSRPSHSVYMSFLEFRAQGYLCAACHSRRALVANVQAAFAKTAFFRSLDQMADSSSPGSDPSDPCAQDGACSSNYQPEVQRHE